jgi:hypothetical protein
VDLKHTYTIVCILRHPSNRVVARGLRERKVAVQCARHLPLSNPAVPFRRH